MSTNSIADMCTRIRNAGMRKRSEVQLGPQSKFNRNVLNALVREGWLFNWAFTTLVSSQRKKQAQHSRTPLKADLKYYRGEPTINEIQLVSKPGRRIYLTYRELVNYYQQTTTTPVIIDRGPKQPKPVDYHPFFTLILSTPKGVLSGEEAIRANVGGKVLLYVK